MSDKIRVLRILEYVGERAAVEATLSNSIYGEKTFQQHIAGRHLGSVTIRAATLGNFPEILEKAKCRATAVNPDSELEGYCSLPYDHSGPHDFGF